MAVRVRHRGRSRLRYLVDDSAENQVDRGPQMQAVLCDVCERKVVGLAFELHLIRGEAAKTESGTKLSQRRGSQQIYLCGGCGEWVKRALDHLTEGFRAAREVEELLHPGLRPGD
jgi:hypothetical protein